MTVLMRIIPARAGQTPRAGGQKRRTPDHPRACGANKYPMICHEGRFGSSPRVRGKPLFWGDYDNMERIIPARAGQTRSHPTARFKPPDHPRACGANNWQILRITSRLGSSPRVRGKRRWRRRASHADRIIPARAGQTDRERARGTRSPDHPRACGANEGADGSGELAYGSSPRVRGKLMGILDNVGIERIIPARAGQTRTRRPGLTAEPDHPRACGANGSRAYSRHAHPGSSPRVRGKRSKAGDIAKKARIIPARAGQTHACNQCGLGDADHPRACGANPTQAIQIGGGFGSSPRVRGKQIDGDGGTARTRIIPARAGQTTSRAADTVPGTDHPRACGANRVASSQ